MKNDSRKARREADRVAQAAREAAGLAPGAALPAEGDEVPAPVAAAPPAPESGDTEAPESATAPAATVQPAEGADAGTDPKTEAASPEPAPERIHRAKKRGKALGLVGSLGVLKRAPSCALRPARARTETQWHTTDVFSMLCAPSFLRGCLYVLVFCEAARRDRKSFKQAAAGNEG